MKLFVVVVSVTVLLALSSLTLVSSSPLTSSTNSPSSEEGQISVEPVKRCPPVTCANPKYSQGYQECPTCEGSNCIFKGCVHYGAFDPTWKPDNCTTCYCYQNQAVCRKTKCNSHMECYGYPVVKKPGKCCPECDFGIGKNECGAIPVETKSLYVSFGDDKSCQRNVSVHYCNKLYITDGNGWHMCRAVEGKRKVNMNAEGSKCRGKVSEVTYTDTVECVKEILDYRNIPQDYDPEPHSCSIYIH